MRPTMHSNKDSNTWELFMGDSQQILDKSLWAMLSSSRWRCWTLRLHSEHLTCSMPSQSARSRALASAVDRPTTLTLLEVWDEMKLVLDTMTSSTGPLSSPGTNTITRSNQSAQATTAESEDLTPVEVRHAEGGTPGGWRREKNRRLEPDNYSCYPGNQPAL